MRRARPQTEENRSSDRLLVSWPRTTAHSIGRFAVVHSRPATPDGRMPCVHCKGAAEFSSPHPEITMGSPGPPVATTSACSRQKVSGRRFLVLRTPQASPECTTSPPRAHTDLASVLHDEHYSTRGEVGAQPEFFGDYLSCPCPFATAVRL